MNTEDFQLLTQPEVLDFVEQNLRKKTIDLALSRRGNGQFPPLVYTQIKNLQKSEKKIPSFFAARALLPSRALEQCSSEATASLKDMSGDRFLDLCCGLGVDSYFLSKKFHSGIALEGDPGLAAVTTYNFQRLDVSQLEVLNQKAAAFLATYQGPPFDLIYADPDRRDAQGKRKILLEELQPSIPDLLPLIRQHSKRMLLKLSPLFDITEAEKQFQPWLHRLAVISVDNECKELWVECIFDRKPGTPFLEVKVLNKGVVQTFSTSLGTGLRTHLFDSWESLTERFPHIQYMLEPDVAFYKARTTTALIQQLGLAGKGAFNHPEGYFFSEQMPPPGFPGRVFEIQDAMPFQPKKVKKKWGETALSCQQATRRC